MKRLLVAVLVLAGCGSRTPPQERPLPPGMVTLATFTAEADPAAGTFTIRTQPTAAGRANGMASLVSTDVLVQNDPAAPVSPNPWFLETGDRGCGATTTWGAYVKVTSLVPGDVWLGGVYAEINSYTGPAGGEACNGLSSAETPEGLDSTRGLWAYPTISPGPTGAQSVPWTFTRVDGSAVTFSGRIVAAKVGVTEVPENLPVEGDQILGVYDQLMVYLAASGDVTGLQFVTFSGALAGFAALPDFSSAIAPSFRDHVIWFATNGTPGLIGFINEVNVLSYLSDAGGDLGGIVPDPTVPGRAWYRSNAGGYIRSIDTAAPPVLGVPMSTLSFAPYGMAFGADGKLYVTVPSDNRILVYTKGVSASGLVFEDDFDTGDSCAQPTTIISGPGGTMWFGAYGSKAVCSFATGTTTVAPVNAADGPMQLAVGPDGNVWVAATGVSQVARMDATGPGYRVDLFNGSGAFGVATGGGKLWAADIFGIYPITLDTFAP